MASDSRRIWLKFGVPTVLVGLLLFGTGPNPLQVTRTFAKVQGTVTAVRESRGENSRLYQPVFSYRFPPNGELRASMFRTASSHTNYRIGDTIEVWVNPENPTQAIANHFVELWLWPSLGASLLVLMTWLTLKQRQMVRERIARHQWLREHGRAISGIVAKVTEVHPGGQGWREFQVELERAESAVQIWAETWPCAIGQTVTMYLATAGNANGEVDACLEVSESHTESPSGESPDERRIAA